MVEGLAADVQGGQAAWGILELAPLRFPDAHDAVSLSIGTGRRCRVSYTLLDGLPGRLPPPIDF